MPKHSSLNNAKKLRAAMTPAENLLWYFLRDQRFGGLKFRRQVPIGNYIVDFICFEEKLIIELDGGQHMTRETNDKIRTNNLNFRGFKLIRFWNHEVLYDTQSVLTQLLQILNLEQSSCLDIYF